MTSRERTHSWSDPSALAAAAAGRDGLTFLKELADGTLPPPPIMGLVGAWLETAEPGHVVFTFEPAEYHYNPIGSVHGGIYATMLDSACGCAVQSTLEPDVAYTSLDLSVKFLRRLTADSGTARATGHVVHAGRSTALARAELHDGAGRLVAEATSSCLILRP